MFPASMLLYYSFIWVYFQPTPVRKPTLKRPLSASKDEPRPSTSKTPPTKRQKILVNTQTVKSPVKSPETPKSSESIVIPDYSKTPNISKDEFYQEIGLSPEPTKIKSKDVYDMPDDEEMDKVRTDVLFHFHALRKSRPRNRRKC